MKNLLHNISILAVLALMMVGIQSCSDDWQEVGDVRVSFTATLPTDTRTRSFGKAEQVNTLVVGIFKKGVADVHTNSSSNWSYHEIDRKSFPIYDTSADVQLTLAQEQTYSFIFWAYDSNQNIYNIDDLTAIEMNALPNPITFTQAEAADAFFATMGDITITGDCSYPVELVRPLAQNQCRNYRNTDAGIIYSKRCSRHIPPIYQYRKRCNRLHLEFQRYHNRNILCKR